jgi:hypothetical protein
MNSPREDLCRVSVHNPHEWARVKENISREAMSYMDTQLSSSLRQNALDQHMNQVRHPDSRGQTFDIILDSSSQPPSCVQNITYASMVVIMRIWMNVDSVRAVTSDIGRTVECTHPIDIEPFDEMLDKNIWSLSDQRIKLDQQNAIKRRIKPQELEVTLERILVGREDEDVSTVSQDPDEMDVYDCGTTLFFPISPSP